MKTETTVELAAVVVNRVLPELFGRGEEEVFETSAAPSPWRLWRLVACDPLPVIEGARLAVRLRTHRRGASRPASVRDRPVGSDAARSDALHPRVTGCARHARSPATSRRSSVTDVIPTPEPRPRRIRSLRAPGAARSLRDGLARDRREIVVACGPGRSGQDHHGSRRSGNGRLAPRWEGPRATVDPAKRLADALAPRGHREPRDPRARRGFPQRRARPRGELWAAMLDTKESWDALIRRHAPDERTRNEILSNPLYGQISSRFVQSHDYIAMERLYEIHAEGDYDLIVVDTPPTRNALDFLDAPERMAEFFSSRLLRWLIVPYRSRLVNIASRPFYQVADRILGTQFLEDISQFFILFQTMYNGFIERAQAVGRLLADRRTSFIVVTTLEAAPLHEAQVFINELGRRDLHVGPSCSNKVLPAYLRDPSGRDRRREVEGQRPLTRGQAPSQDPSSSDLDQSPAERVIAEVGSSYLDYNLVAQREAEQRAELAHIPDVLVSVPYFESDVHDLAGLLELGERLWS